VLAAYDGAAELDRGLDLLFTGLTATLTHPDGSPRTIAQATATTSAVAPT
jgi:hypothetical protein